MDKRKHRGTLAMTKRFRALSVGLMLAGAVSASSLATAAQADETNDGAVSTDSLVGARRLGEHPAVIAQRLHAKQDYDYASKFYPHPAWLWLYSEAPRPMMDHPAVIVAKRQKEVEAQAAPITSTTPAQASAATGAPVH
jgi:hypothetical protein